MNVSIITPAYNAAQTIAIALKSLQAQTISQWEAVVVNDGSTDETATIVEKIAAQDGRIRLINQPNQGVCTARNTGIREASYDWLLFLDADDWIAPDYLERMTAVLEADPTLDAVHCGSARVTPDGQHALPESCHKSGDLFPTFAILSAFPIHACLVRRTIVEAAGCFDSSFVTCEDWDLWQRVARLGARFGRLPETLAFYRMRPHSLSADGFQMFRDALRVLETGCAADPRAENPLPAYAEGISGDLLPTHKLSMAAWMAGLVLGAGDDPLPLLDLVKETQSPQLNPFTIAENLFKATLITSCLHPEAWVELWPQVESSINAFLEALEAHSLTPKLARRARISLERQVATAVIGKRPFQIGTFYAIYLDISQPLADVEPPAGVTRLLCAVAMEGILLGQIELPVCDGQVSRYVLADTLAAHFAWQIMGRYFEHTVYPQLTVKQATSGTSVWCGNLLLAENVTAAEDNFWATAHHQIGWTIFLQELWGCPDLPDTAFYEPEGADDKTVWQQLDNAWITLEVSEPLPNLRLPGKELKVMVTVGGTAIGVVDAQAGGDGTISAQALRAAITTTTGFELCCAAVREGIIGRSLTTSEPLRQRLANTAVNHKPPTRHWPDSLILGRRNPGLFGTSASRRAMLPVNTADLMQEAAAALSEPVILPTSGQPVAHAVYLPDLLNPTPSANTNLAERLDKSDKKETAPAQTHDRHYFESLFATQPDPWQYTSPYEQTKYEQTLAMLPDKQFHQALEIACAEGHFTAQIAPRVTQLLATDISQIALERAARYCAGQENIRFAHLDLAHDDLPGTFDLIICSEMLYYVGSLDKLKSVAQKITKALRSGGLLVMAHANLLVDDPDQPGYDWDMPFGARRIGETFAEISDLRFIKELSTPLYRIQLFQRQPYGWFFKHSKKHEVIEVAQPTPPPPRAASSVCWHGGQKSTYHEQQVESNVLPILMYHNIAASGHEQSSRYRVTPAAFAQQMEYLYKTGYYTISLQQWLTAVTDKKPLPGRPIHITFDDGYTTFLTEAWPILKQYGLTATVFLVAALIGGDNIWDEAYSEKLSLLNWEEILQLQQEGVEFGSHTMNHPFLTSLSITEIVQQAVQSRAILQKRLQQPVNAIAYPYGDFDPTVEHLIGASGYIFGLSCRPGVSRFHDGLLALPRIEVTGFDQLSNFIAKVSNPEK
jgi:glycosyltransferase involved in cell wall biosynthesis/peptidoglycan/xylan/chitin deacetylase (PgdA/CDA1 family)/2-polyprenyl-3-methyl-5-hydroxy-6-metoxy-1,4-benzoquinol methylase